MVNAFLDQIVAVGGEAAVDLTSLLEADEGDRLEFKETARVNVHTGNVDDKVVNSALKTIAAFMNSHGGTLVIGVKDVTKEVTGLDRDLATLGKKDTDGYELFIRQLMNNAVGAEHSSRVSVAFPRENGRMACVVLAPRSPRPVYVRDGDDRHLFVRDGNSTRRLNSEEAVRYVAEHFGKADRA
jgi:predicted HTH transcriptional regulator